LIILTILSFITLLFIISIVREIEIRTRYWHERILQIEEKLEEIKDLLENPKR